MSDDDIDMLSEKIVDLMRSHGCNCAEAVVRIMAERYGFDPGYTRFVTAFGGGMSEKADSCGFLIGGLVTISLLFGRVDTDDVEKKRKSYNVGREYYTWFMKEFGRCCDIKGDPKVGPWDVCHDVGRRVVPFLIGLIDRNL